MWNASVVVSVAVLLTAASFGFAGESAGELQLSAKVAKTIWVAGAPATIEVTLTNKGDSPVLVDLFGELDALYEGKRRHTYVTSCWALSWEPAPTLETPRRGRYTLEAAQFHRLAPGESVTTSLTRTLNGTSPGTYEVRVVYIPRMASPSFSLPDHWETQHGFHDRIWIGMIYSNPITITVTS